MSYKNKNCITPFKADKGVALQVQLDTHTMTLEDMPLDEGYASETIKAKDMNGAEVSLGGQTGKTQIIISAPYLDQQNHEEFDQLFKDKDLALEDVERYFILSSREDIKVATDMPLLFDEDEEFGDEYGLRICDAPMEGKLTKAVYIISKDGAIFYEQVPKDLKTPFELDKIYKKTVAALACYTGKGCH